MIKFIINLIRKIGIDGAIAYTILARVLQALGGVATIFFIARYLNKTEQGFYYTFGSIIAIQIFFELGLSNIITQFVAHEKAHLEWDGKTNLIGDEKSLSRLAHLLRFCIIWFSVIALFLFIALLIAGYLFFNKYGQTGNNIDWSIPWLILAIVTAVDLIISPILAYLVGLGMVKQVAQVRLVQQISQLFCLYLFLMVGFKLYSSPLAAAIAFLIVPSWLFFSNKKPLLCNILKIKKQWKVDYKKEIFPYQWKIALSWISGYFIFQLFNPVVFATEGAIVAGQMGMTLAIMSGVLSVPISWINTKVPLFSSLIARKDYFQLDQVFNKTLFQSSIVCLMCLAVLLTMIFGLNYFHLPIAKRFLPFKFILILSVVTFANQIISALATYLRCHKQEPFLVQSIVLGILTAISTLLFGKLYGINGILIGYCSIILFGSLIWSLIIFRNKKALWHS